MVTRRTDARRRRVLSEEFVPTDQDAVAGSRKPMQAYSYGANRRNQPKTTDMIPKRALSLGLFFLLVAGTVTILNLLAGFASPLASVVGERGAETFALSGAGTLANWLCSLSLFLCSGVCVQLFYLRKHKRDDYGGMYYVWLLMAVMFFFASIDCAIDLRTIVAKLFEAATQRSLLETPWLMMSIELIVLAVVVIRLLFEVRTSRFSLAAVLLAWLGFVGCVVLRNSDIASSVDWLNQKVAYGNCVLVGCVGSLVSLVVYARFVFLHAHGLIRLKVDQPQELPSDEPVANTTEKKSTRRKKSVTQESSEESSSVVEAPSVKTPQPVTTQNTTKVTASPKTKPKPARKAKAKPAPVKVEPTAAKTTAKKAAARQTARPAAKPAAAPTARTKTNPTAATTNPTKAAPKQKVAEAPADSQLQEELEQIETVSMSKSERRRLRKLAKRAARGKKAA